MLENYFSTPTIENSYYAGFIAADGCIVDKVIRGQNKLQIILSEQDYSLLHNLHLSLQLGDKKISYRPSRVFRQDNKDYFRKPSYCFSVSSNKICEDLYSNWNITPRKTNTLLPPNLSDEKLIKTFLIGVIDGDGCIYLGDYLELSIVGNSKQFLLWCKKSLSDIGNIIECPTLINHHGGFRVKYSNNKAKKIISSLLEVDVPRLKRKWEKVSCLKGF